MNRKNNPAAKFLTFLEGKGFYLAVLFCVGIVGLSGWLIARNMMGISDADGDAVMATATPGELDPGSAEVSGNILPSDTPAGAGAEIIIPPSQKPASSVPSPSISPLPSTQPTTPATPSPSPTQNSTAEKTSGMSTPVPLVYTWPVKGELIGEHSGDRLVYNETMGDWRVHAGMDIAVTAGTNVLSTAAGTVTSVEQHDLMGTTVVIDHGEGMISRYCNLQATPTVEPGDKVYTGSVIGAVGKTAIAESAIAPHLHFELLCNGQSVDPLEYLPKP